MKNWGIRLHRRQMRKPLQAFLMGELPPAQREQMQQHLADCPDCRAALEAMHDAEDALTAARPEPQALGLSRSDSLFRAALQESRSQSRRPSLPLAASLTLAAAGIGIVLFALHTARPHIPTAVSFETDTDSLSLKMTEKRVEARVSDFFKLPDLSTPDSGTRLRGDAPRHRHRRFARRSRRQPARLLAGLHVPSLLEAALSLHKTDTTADLSDRTLARNADNTLAELAVQRTKIGRLVLIVTGQETERLKVEVTAGEPRELGFAKVSAVLPDAAGNTVLHQCMIRNDDDSESIYTTHYRLLAGKPISRLTLETSQPAETSSSLEKGTKP